MMTKLEEIDIKCIKENLPTDFSSLNIYTYEEVTSTNTIAKEYAQKNNPLPALFISKKQTQGRGRQGRSFYSQLAHGLYFTLVITPDRVKSTDISLYTLLIGVVLAQTIEEIFGLSLKIKWVNDLFYNNKKVIGILSESVWSVEDNKVNALILGTGINLAGSFADSPEEVQKVAGTLFNEIPKDLDVTLFFYKFLTNFSKYQTEIETREFLSIYKERLLGLNQEITYIQNRVQKKGIITGLNQNGNLLVQLPNGKIDTLHGQDIHFSSTQFLP